MDTKNAGNLKINVVLGPFKIELEGESSVVVEQFNEIKKTGLGLVVEQLTPLVNRKETPILQSGDINDDKEVITEHISADRDMPSLKSLTLRSLPATESEWVTVYGYYTIDQTDKQVFTREDINEKYKESGRDTRNNIKNLSISIKRAVEKLWINPINDHDYTVTDDGNVLVKEIFSRTKGTVRIPKKRKTVNGGSGEVKSKALDPNVKP